MEKFIEKFINSKFMNVLKSISEKTAKNSVFSSISVAMQSTMGLIMIGAISQVICAIGSLAFGWETTDVIYQVIYAPYNLTMGILGFWIVISLTNAYAKRLKQPILQTTFTAVVSFMIVAALPEYVTNNAGNSYLGLNLGNLGTSAIFLAIIVSLLCVNISKFCTDRNITIKIGAGVPEGVLNSFNSIIPSALAIVFWYAITLGLSSISGGALTLNNAIIFLLSIPMSLLLSAPGMVLLVTFGQLFWFFGIHGTSIVFAVFMPFYFQAFSTNAGLAALGLPLVFNFAFLYGAVATSGGSGNTLALSIFGLKSKSEQIQTLSKASLIPGIFGINEPLIFGYPIMYNPILLIPFVLNPIAVMACMAFAYKFNLMSLPSVLIMAQLPIGLGSYLSTFDLRNVLFTLLMIPLTGLIYYPFFKVYEKQCIEREAADKVLLNAK